MMNGVENTIEVPKIRTEADTFSPFILQSIKFLDLKQRMLFSECSSSKF